MKSKQKTFSLPRAGAPNTRGPSSGAGAPGVAITPLILHTESIKSARVLIIATSLWSFNLITRHTFSIMFKSGDCTGQVIPGIAFSIFQSRVNLELCAGALSSWNINGCSAKCFATTGSKCTFRIFVYFFESMVPSTGTRVPTPSYVMQPQKVADTDTRERPPTSPGTQ